MVGTGDGREIGEDEPGRLRPGAGRRAVHRAGRAAAPARGALASYARRPGRPRRPAARAARSRRSRPPGPAASSAYVTCCPHLGETRFVVRRRASSGARTSSRPGRPAAVRRRAGCAGRRTSATGPFVQLWPHRARHRRDVPGPAAQAADGGAVVTTYHVPVQISPSILAADFANLETELRRIANADWAHVDVMDDHFVPNLTLGLPVVEALARVSPVPLDCHLMIEDPDRWASAVRRGRRVQRHLPRRGRRRRPGAGARPALGRGPRRDGAQARHRRSRPTPTCCRSSTWSW